MHAILGNRQVCVTRELTKKFEEVIRGEIFCCVGISAKPLQHQGRNNDGRCGESIDKWPMVNIQRLKTKLFRQDKAPAAYKTDKDGF